MPIKIIARKELKDMLTSILRKSVTFRFLSKDKELNPCRISFDGMEFYIYIINLSPAQLSNDNPDIWRVQLNKRNAFNKPKESDIPFIMLGYDNENQVFATWNPYMVKQRLNVCKCVSLYSRLSLQKYVNEMQSFQRCVLNNDGEVVAFPCSKLGYYLVNIKQFFPEMTEYVAMGSRKRSEANTAYHCLCNSKNIAGYARYLKRAKYSTEAINNYCRAIKKLISDSWFSRNRKLFLACDSLIEYPSAVDSFLEIPEIQEINRNSNNQYSDALRTYIAYLLEINNLNGDIKNAPADELQDSAELTSNIDSSPHPSNENNVVDWEGSEFTDSHGKLTRIANPKLIDLLRPVLDTEYRKLSAAYNIVSDFYGDRYENKMELKDWNGLFNNIDWQSPYFAPPQSSNSKH